MMPADLPVDTYRETFLRYFDGTGRTVLTTDVETPFPEGRLIVSRTDPQGIITHVNEAFVIMSGHAESDLIGAPHYILRHPDMPSVAFKGLWDTLEGEPTWHGYVKNLRKDGGYYWVYATIITNVRDGRIVGYSSVRRKPARRKVEECTSLYRSLLEEEQSQG
jgi:PAS domain S-box-containing protein